MKFKYEYVLLDKKLTDLDIGKELLNEQIALNCGQTALKSNPKARYCEIYQYRFVKGFQKDRACVGMFTKSESGEISYRGY